MVLSLPSALPAVVEGVWAIGITLGLIFLFRRISLLTAGTKKERLDEVLEQLLLELQKDRQSQRQIEKELVEITDQLPHHLQKIGLIRFNPFSGTGGNQSFSLAVLDGHNSGVILTSLHSRDGTRLYTKPVQEGKSQGELSSEEQAALKAAREIK